MSQKNYYDVLGVSKSASSSEIKKAYLKLAKQYHPDRNSGDKESEKKFKEISAAYDILKDEQKKTAYDRFGHDAFTQAGAGSGGGFGHNAQGFSDINDIFGDIFGDFMGGRRSGQSSWQSRGADLKYSLAVSLEDAFSGVNKKIKFATEVSCSPCSGRGSKDSSTNRCGHCGGAGVVRMQQGFFTVEQTCSSCAGTGQIIKNPCNTCHGKGRVAKQKNLVVNIPAGVEDNTRIRLAGEGEAGTHGAASGDLYVFVTVKPHDVFKVENSDLHCQMPILFSKAALGCEVEVPTIEGKNVILKVPAGTKSGDRLKLKGKGMSKVRSSSRGDMYVHADVLIPKKLSKKQQELLEEFDRDFAEKNEDSGFFSKVKNIWS